MTKASKSNVKVKWYNGISVSDAYALENLGKRSRLGRIFDYKTKTSIIIPMDHSTESHHDPLERPMDLIRRFADADVDAFLLMKGLARSAAPEYIDRCGLVYRISGATGLRNKLTEQAYISGIETAVKLGASAVTSNIFVGSEREIADLTRFGEISDTCDEWGMPFLAEVFPIGGKDSEPFDGPYSAEDLRLAVRVAYELGADCIKTYYTGDVESFKMVVRNCPIPIIIAGGPKAKSVDEVLHVVKGAMDAGAVGVAMGRKIWGSKDPIKLVEALKLIIRDKHSVEEASRVLA